MKISHPIPAIARKFGLVLGLLLALMAATSPAIADGVTVLAQRLTKLRGEVEAAAEKLNSKTAETNDVLRSLARQKADLELEVKREQTRLQKISAAIAKRRSESEAQRAKGDQLVPLFSEALGNARTYVQGTLPFRTKERLVALDKIEEQYKAGLLTPARALSRVWSFVEDEFRMTRESGLYQQTLAVDGQEILADVIRVGMVMMYFKSADDNVYGKATKRDGKWSFVVIDGTEDRKLVSKLFESFKKQIRVGYFELPDALGERVAQ